MPTLDNPRHERFAQELAQGKSASDAYAAAGYKPNRHNAAALAREEHILTRVAQLQGRAAERAEVTTASLIEEAEAVRKAAFGDGQYAAAISAIKEKGILAGVRVEKRETQHKHDAKSMSDDELALIASGGSQGIAAPAPRSRISH